MAADHRSRCFLAVYAALVLAVTACVPREPSTAAAAAVTVLGVRLAPPGDGTWRITRVDSTRTELARASDEAALRLVAEVLPLDATADELAFLRAAEARQEAATAQLAMVSVHYNRAQLRGASCLQYDGIFRDTAAAAGLRTFRTQKGYVCRHPGAAGHGIHLGFTHHAATRTSSVLDAGLIAADAFFGSAVFTGLPRAR